MPIPQTFVAYSLAVPANAVCEGPSGKVWCSCATDAYTEGNAGPTDLIVTPKQMFSPTDYPVTYPTDVNRIFGFVGGRTNLVSYEGYMWFVALCLIEPAGLPYPVLAQVDPATGSVINWFVGTGDTVGGSYLTNLVVGPDGNFWFLSNSVEGVIQVTTSGVFTTYPYGGYGGYSATNLISGPDYLYAVYIDDLLDAELVQIATDGTQTSIATLANMDDGPQYSAMLFGPDGNIWIAYYYPDVIPYGFAVLIFDTSGALLDTFTFNTPPDWSTDGFLPKDMTHDGTNVYVCGWWWSTLPYAASDASSVFQITTAGAFTEQDLYIFAETSRPSGIICHSVDKSIWISDWWGPNPWGKLWGPPGSTGWHVGQIAVQ